MYVKVSKVFAKFINKTAREMGFKCMAKVIKCNVNSYGFCTGDDVIDARCYGDYNNDDTIKVLQVVYPYEYHACERLVTTRQLIEEFKRRKVSNFEDLKEMVRDMFEI